jgi:hypothetical protein
VHFCLPFYYSFILFIALHYHFIPALAEYQQLVNSTLLFSSATQTCCYFLLLLKPTAQKEKIDWNSSTKSSRLRVAPVVVPIEL